MVKESSEGAVVIAVQPLNIESKQLAPTVVACISGAWVSVVQLANMNLQVADPIVVAEIYGMLANDEHW